MLNDEKCIQHFPSVQKKLFIGDIPMKPTNVELVAELEQAVDGLLYPSESDYPFGTVVWEVTEQGEFRVGKLFNLISKETNDFLQRCKK